MRQCLQRENKCIVFYASPSVVESERRRAFHAVGRPLHQLTVADKAEVRVDDILYTQKTCSEVFSDGSSLQDSVAGLDSGRVNPLREPKLRVTVARWPGRGLVSLDNRRVWCFKDGVCFSSSLFRLLLWLVWCLDSWLVSWFVFGWLVGWLVGYTSLKTMG